MTNSGDMGEPGLTGPVGYPGLKGDRGQPGERGMPGPLNEIRGEKGEPGLVGLVGLPGPAGLPGLNYIMKNRFTAIDKFLILGLQGEPGLPGLQGDTGAPGPVGLPGMDGIQGQKGEQGLFGERGDIGPVVKGEKGLFLKLLLFISNILTNVRNGFYEPPYLELSLRHYELQNCTLSNLVHASRSSKYFQHLLALHMLNRRVLVDQ